VVRRVQPWATSEAPTQAMVATGEHCVDGSWPASSRRLDSLGVCGRNGEGDADCDHGNG